LTQLASSREKIMLLIKLLKTKQKIEDIDRKQENKLPEN